MIPLFKKQIESGGPVTITNNEMTRFIMPMRDAINLLLKATELAQGGEIFIFKMAAIRIPDLAAVMVEELAPKYGQLQNALKMEIIGTKPGEKSYEELMTEDEAGRALETEDMFIVLPEMRELPYKPNYLSTSHVEVKAYTSKEEEHLSKEEIRKILHKENLL